MSFWSTLFGSHQEAADSDPHPGIGGYTDARGPDGETGYPGSTSWTRLNPPAAAQKRPAGPVRPVRTPPWGRPVPRPRPLTITEQQADVIPFPAQDGSLPYQGPDAKTNPDRVRDTEQRPRIVISQGTPGDENQRNTVYYGGRQAVPGAVHSYRSAPKGDDFGTTEVSVPSRYVFGGINGGTDNLDDLMTARRMPYTGHGGSIQEIAPSHGLKNIRGAVLDGNRYYQEPDGGAGLAGRQGGGFGYYGSRANTLHRPTVFAEPAPWASQYYDTTADAGTPDQPGLNSQVTEQVLVSPAATRAPRGFRRR